MVSIDSLKIKVVSHSIFGGSCVNFSFLQERIKKSPTNIPISLMTFITSKSDFALGSEKTNKKSRQIGSDGFNLLNIGYPT